MRLKIIACVMIIAVILSMCGCENSNTSDAHSGIIGTWAYEWRNGTHSYFVFREHGKVLDLSESQNGSGIWGDWEQLDENWVAIYWVDGDVDLYYMDGDSLVTGSEYQAYINNTGSYVRVYQRVK